MTTIAQPLPKAEQPPQTRWIYLALILLPVLVLGRVMWGEFLTWDDFDNVARNPAMLAPPGEQIPQWWLQIDKPYLYLYVPVTYSTWNLISQVTRLDSPRPDGIQLSALPFHATNLLLHVTGGIIVFLILLRLVENAMAAAIGAMIFLIHPVQVEAAAWVTGLKDVLSGFLSIFSIWMFAKFLDEPEALPATAKSKRDSTRTPNHPIKWIWYGLATLAVVLSMLAKPSAVMAPVLAAIVGYALIEKRSDASGKSSARAIRFLRVVAIPLIPWLIAAVLVSFETQHGQPPNVQGTSLWTRPLIASDALAFYLQKLALPIGLVPDYGRTPSVIAQGSFFPLAWIVPVLTVAVGVLLFRKDRLILIGILLFFVAPLPVLGLVPFRFQAYSTVADRFIYLGMLGAAIVVAALLRHIESRIIVLAGSAAIVLFGALSFIQAGYWHDTRRLFSYNLTVNPRSVVSHSQIAYVASSESNFDEASQHYAAAVALRPFDFFSNFNWGNLMLRHGNAEGATDRYKAALSSDAPDDLLAQIHNNYGIALVQLHRPKEAMDEFQKGTQGAHPSADAEVSLAKLLLMQRNVPAAHEHLQRALEINPNHVEAKKLLGRIEEVERVR